MPARFLVHALLLAAVAAGLGLAADALVVSDEEAVERLGDDLVGGGGDAVLPWVDLAEAPLSLQAGGRAVRYEEGDELEAGEALADALRPFAAPDLEVVQRSASVEGDRATVSVRVRAGGELHDATFRLARGGSGWWVRRVVAR